MHTLAASMGGRLAKATKPFTKTSAIVKVAPLGLESTPKESKIWFNRNGQHLREESDLGGDGRLFLVIGLLDDVALPTTFVRNESHTFRWHPYWFPKGVADEDINSF